jgi:hypothetical protein
LWQIVDFYYPSGKKFREWFIIARVSRSGHPLQMTLDGRGNKPIGSVDDRFDEKAIEMLKQQCADYIRSISPAGTLHSSPSGGWVRLAEGASFQSADAGKYLWQFEWDDDQGGWRSIESQGEIR